MVQWLRRILQNIGFQVSDAPTPVYEDSQATIDIIKSNHITSRFLKNISSPSLDIDYYIRLALNTLHTPYGPTGPSKYP